MTLPTFATIESAVDDLYAAFSEDATLPESRHGVVAIDELKKYVEDIYRPKIYAEDLSRFTNGFDFSAGLVSRTVGARTANGRQGEYGQYVMAGDIIYLLDATDFGDGALAVDKGGAVAAGDMYVALTGITFAYLGTTGLVWTGTDTDDFMDL